MAGTHSPPAQPSTQGLMRKGESFYLGIESTNVADQDPAQDPAIFVSNV